MLLVPENGSASLLEPHAPSPDIEMKDDPPAIEEEGEHSKTIGNDKFSFDGHEYMRLKRKRSLAFDQLALEEENKLQHLAASLGPDMTVWLDYRMAKEKQKTTGQGRAVTQPKGIPPLYEMQDLDYDPLCRDGLTPEQELREVERCRAAAAIVFPGIFEETGDLYTEQSTDEMVATPKMFAFVEGVFDGRAGAANHHSTTESNPCFQLDQGEILKLLDSFPNFEPGTDWFPHNELTRVEQAVLEENVTAIALGNSPKDGVLPSPKRVKFAIDTIVTGPADHLGSQIAGEDHVMSGTEGNNGSHYIIRAINVVGEVAQLSASVAQMTQHVRVNLQDNTQVGVPTETRMVTKVTSTIKIDDISEGHLNLAIASLAMNHVATEPSEDEGEIIEKNATRGTAATMVGDVAAIDKGSRATQSIEPIQMVPPKKGKFAAIAMDKRNKDVAATESTQGSGISTKGRLLKSTYKKSSQVSGPKDDRLEYPPASARSSSVSTSNSYGWSWGAAVQPNRPGGQGSRHPPPHPPPSFGGQGPSPNPQGFSFSTYSVNHTSSQVFGTPSIPQRNPNPQAILSYSPPRVALRGPIAGSHTNARGRLHNRSIDVSTPAGKNPSTPPQGRPLPGSRRSSSGSQINSFPRNGSPTPARSPGGNLHRGGGDNDRGRGRGNSHNSRNPRGGSQARTDSRFNFSPSLDDSPIPLNLVQVQSPPRASLEFASCRFPSKDLRDDALARIQDAILRVDSLNALNVIEPHANEVTLRVSGPLGSNVRGTIKTMFPSAKITASMT